MIIKANDCLIWVEISHSWYSKAAESNSIIGCLYHHLIILICTCTLKQLSLYARSLTSVQSFDMSQTSIVTVFKLILNEKNDAPFRASQLKYLFIKAHTILFHKDFLSAFSSCVFELLDLFDHYIGKMTAKFKSQAVFTAMTNITVIFEYGLLKSDSCIRLVFQLIYVEVESKKCCKLFNFKSSHTDDSTVSYDSHSSKINKSTFSTASLTSDEIHEFLETVICVLYLTFSTLLIDLQSIDDSNALSFVHMLMIFLFSLTIVDRAMAYVKKDVSWKKLSLFLNTLTKSKVFTSEIKTKSFPQPFEGVKRSLSKDFIIHDQLWSQWYFSVRWFKDAKINNDERASELSSMIVSHIECILWLSIQIASSEQWLHYDIELRRFSVTQYTLNLWTEPLSTEE